MAASSRPASISIPGRADAVFQEATGHDHWLEIFHRRQMVCLPPEPHVIESLREDFGWQPISVPAGTYANQPEPLPTLDASGWILCARADLPDDIAYSVARIAAEHGAEIALGRAVGAPAITVSPNPWARRARDGGYASSPSAPGRRSILRRDGIL
jgi:TRAP-type uncharacterized transport system substrate-binding protein